MKECIKELRRETFTSLLAILQGSTLDLSLLDMPKDKKNAAEILDKNDKLVFFLSLEWKFLYLFENMDSFTDSIYFVPVLLQEEVESVHTLFSHLEDFEDKGFQHYIEFLNDAVSIAEKRVLSSLVQSIKKEDYSLFQKFEYYFRVMLDELFNETSKKLFDKNNMVGHVEKYYQSISDKYDILTGKDAFGDNRKKEDLGSSDALEIDIDIGSDNCVNGTLSVNGTFVAKPFTKFSSMASLFACRTYKEDVDLVNRYIHISNYPPFKQEDMEEDTDILDSVFSKEIMDIIDEITISAKQEFLKKHRSGIAGMDSVAEFLDLLSKKVEKYELKIDSRGKGKAVDYLVDKIYSTIQTMGVLEK